MTSYFYALDKNSSLHSRREELGTEQEIVKCITYILNHKVGIIALCHCFLPTDRRCDKQSATDIALSYNANIMVTHIASALNTPQLPTRRLILDILVFLVYCHDGRIYSLVITALETLSEDNGETGGCYAFWFKSLQSALSGKSQASVSNGQPQRRSTEGETALTEYLVCTLFLLFAP